MTRKQFLNDLYLRLTALGPERAEQHLTYYAEMLADRMEEGMSEEEAVASMEDLDTIARRILEEEGQPEEPQPVMPPACPDASRIPGGGGRTCLPGCRTRGGSPPGGGGPRRGRPVGKSQDFAENCQTPLARRWVFVYNKLDV